MLLLPNDLLLPLVPPHDQTQRFFQILNLLGVLEHLDHFLRVELRALPRLLLLNAAIKVCYCFQ